MRILYIHQHFDTPSGTGGTRSYAFARSLVADGHHVTMVCGASGRSNTNLRQPFVGGRRRGVIDGIDVIEYRIGYATSDNIATRIGKFLRFGIAATRIALSHDYDLIFCTSTPLTAAVPGILAHHLRRKPFVFEVRDLWPELPRALGVTNPALLDAMSILEWSAYHSADRVVGLAPGIVEGIARRGIAKSRISFIPNGCDLELFGDVPPRHASEMLPGRIAPSDFVCVYAGAHGIANGLDALLAAAAALKRAGRDDIKLLLIGNGATKPGLVTEAKARTLDNLVFCDSVSKVDLIPLLRGADAGLQLLKNIPAFYDGTSPNKFFDYLAAGIPIIVNYPGWIGELVREFDCGLNVAPDDPEAFAKAVVGAADAKTAWKAKGRNSLSLARARFDRRELAKQFADALRSAVPVQSS